MRRNSIDMNLKKTHGKRLAVCSMALLLFSCFIQGCSGNANTKASPSPLETQASQEATSFPGASTASDLYINLDSSEDSLPNRMRTSNDVIKNQVGDRTISLNGLKDLKISGSGQFSEVGLQLLKKAIGSSAIVIVDLRQESHGFANGIAFSYMDKDNKANKGLSPQQVTVDETARLKTIKSVGSIKYKSVDAPLKVKTINTEKELVKSLGMTYVRFPVANNEWPTDDVVDDFVLFVRSQPKKNWMHFHCMEGVGRTTLFMVMYDAMKNAKNVSLEDIMDRQVLLGGKNLLQTGSDERAAFLRSFYDYCKENNDGYKTSWSQWTAHKP